MGTTWGRAALVALLLFFCVWPTSPARAQQTVRVGLGTGLVQAEVQIYRSAYEIVDLASGTALARAERGSSWVVTPSAVGLEIRGPEGSGVLVAQGGVLFRGRAQGEEKPVFSLAGKRYRGDLQLVLGNEGLTAVNVLDVEEYLLGVVGEELGYRAPLEALKAQAVASRSYVLARKAVQGAALYDVGADQTTQVYAGYEAEGKPGFSRVKAAVEATRGEVLSYQGKLVEAFYHANAGGHTENSENVWQQARPYLRGVASPWDEFALQYEPQSPSGWPACSYRWEKTLSREQLDKRLAAWNQARAAWPEQTINVGEVIGLRFSRLGSDGRPTVSGRITRVVFVGRTGEKELRGETARSLLELRSTLFTASLDSQVFVCGTAPGLQEWQAAEGLRALAAGGGGPLNGSQTTYWVIGGGGVKRSLPKIFTQVAFSGQGHGHGVGMSQWGAWGMAAAGYDYRAILEHYYNQGKNDGRLQVAPYRGSGA